MQALKRDKTYRFFARRMVGLFIIGLLHIILLWNGDVLHIYALLGLLTMLLLRLSDRIILTGAAIMLLFPFYDQTSELFFRFINFYPAKFLEAYSSKDVIHIIRKGSYREGVQFRLVEYLSNVPLLYSFLAPLAFSMFLLGLYFGKRQFFYSVDWFVDRIAKPVLIIAVLTNIYRILFLFVFPGNVHVNETLVPFAFKLMFLSDVAMGLFYLWLLVWLMRYPRWRRILSPLRHVGRMALTNYIMQSLIGVIIFTSMGFKLYETLSPTQTLVTAVGVFCFQVLFSRLWLARFRFGPLEWLWRCFSYQKILPIKRYKRILFTSLPNDTPDSR